MDNLQANAIIDEVMSIENEDYTTGDLVYKAEKVLREQGIDVIAEYCGGFDSPGYSIDCYSLSYVVGGKLYVQTYQHECY